WWGRHGHGPPLVGHGGTEALLPPFERHDPERELERAPIERFRQLRDDDDAVGERLTGDPAFDLYRGAAPGPALAAWVLGRLGVVEQTVEPAEVADELHVSVDDLGVRVGVEHHRSPAPEQRIAMRGEQGDLLVEVVPADIVGDDPTDGSGEPRG